MVFPLYNKNFKKKNVFLPIYNTDGGSKRNSTGSGHATVKQSFGKKRAQRPRTTANKASQTFS